MNDVKKLKSSIKLSTILAGEGYELINDGVGKYKTRCISPNHIDNNPSLSIKDDICNFQCWSCGIKGDMFNLLEYIKPNLNTFTDKINYIETKYYGVVNEKPFLNTGKHKIEDNKQNDNKFRDIMNYICSYWESNLTKDIKTKYLILNNEIIINGSDKMHGYGISDYMIKSFRIGYSPNSRELYSLLISEFNEEDINNIGLFDTRGMPLFKNRIIVPYIYNGDVVYFTARKTELTPNNDYENAKYKNQNLSNNYFFNEDDLNNLSIFVTEGELDSITLKEYGFNSISIGGLNIKQGELDRLIDFLQEVYLVYIVFDNDKSGKKRADELNKIFLSNGVLSNVLDLNIYGDNIKDINELLAKGYLDEFKENINLNTSV